jgi:hypothetical protein
MNADDAYKLLYQGTYGVGHIMDDTAWRRLVEEAGRVDLKDQICEPVIEDISENDLMVRVNLRPYLRRGLSLEKLFKAMKETIQRESASEDFNRAWSVFKELVRNDEISIEKKKIYELDQEINERGPQTHHHSEAYREAYYPAYRVINKGLLDDLLDEPVKKLDNVD